ncbi:hypothetical protein BRARA_C03646 [Brassica rapa]|uniref:F-box domain-containing protein n=1 Tax=Brassica campestris TaxID=3711 RepID=A0A398A1N8_BRACM|nr:putative F-box/kelch-repeat protein At3g17570 [Brassica rapa]RID71722.1 hypothetical protein BRARA_C03646 [Brassica rapa]CAG7882705.1 unnamed protein product [Brassica rapa]VDC81958.1 unnamed protein product [Brassica rapa]
MVTPKLPWDLESEILSRVPPTSVKRLQLTCKRWNTLFKDQRFINNHMGKATTQMVLKKDESAYSFSLDFHGLHNRYDQFITITGKLQSLKDSEDVKISKIFPCEGLLLCTTKDKNLVVWNPCTGQTRWILSNGYAMNHKYYLGYGNKNKSCDSLKLLRLSYYYHQRLRVNTFEMYEFNSDSWRAFHDDSVNCGILSRGVSLKGNTYWLHSDDEDDDDLVNCILKFDFNTERFGRLSLPFHNDDNDACVVLSVVREEKLALLFQSFATYSPSEMKIWVTNTKADEAKDLLWSLFLVVDYTKVTEVRTRVISFLVDEENKRVMCCLGDYVDEDKTILYVAGEDIHKIVYREYIPEVRDLEYIPSPRLVSYVPSLVRIPLKQSNPDGKRKND